MKTVGCSKVLAASVRAAQSVAIKRSANDSQKALTVVENSGIPCASLPCPSGWKGLTRILAIFSAGSRYEKSPNMHGISHLIRRSCGLSTSNYTGVNLTRHMQQMGAQVQCHTTREHLIYSVDVAPNFADRAGQLLAAMATNTAFYEWELKDQAYKLMRKDIDLLNRRQFDILTIDLLHEAAFGRHPRGSGLGNSLYAESTRIGSHSMVDIDAFMLRHMNPSNVAFLATGTGEGVDGHHVCQAMCEAATFHTGGEEFTPKPATHSFVGGEQRREITGADVTYAAIAWPTLGRGSPDGGLALSVCASALVAPAHSIAYGSSESLVSTVLEDSDSAVVAPLHYSYSDNGVFGLLVSGGCSRDVADLFETSHDALCNLASKGLSQGQLERAKTRFKSSLMMRAENQVALTEDIAVQLVDKSAGDLRYQSPEDICAAVDALQLADVNSILKAVVSSKKSAMATVGSDVAFVPPLSTLSSH